MKYLYARFIQSDGSQKIDRQAIEASGYDKIFVDYASTVGSTDRPNLQEMMMQIQKGDIIEIISIDYLARNINDLLQIVEYITYRDAEIRFLKEDLCFTGDTNNPFNQLAHHIIRSLVEFENSLLKIRQMNGIAIAKAKGVYSKERCKKLSISQQEALKQDIENKVRVCEICKKYGVTKPTYYRYKEQLKN